MTKFVYAIITGLFYYLKYVTMHININKPVRKNRDEIVSKYFKEGI